MLTVRVSATLSPEARDRAIDQLGRESVEVPQQFSGCERFDVFVDPADSHRIFIYEEWVDEASFNAYRTSEYFQAGGDILFPAMVGAPDSAYYLSERVGP